MANANDIDTYHLQLVAALEREGLLGQKAIIRPAPNNDWKNPKFTGPIDFELWPIETPVVAISDHGRRLAVFAFEKLTKFGSGELVEIEDKRNTEICWISWHERWERLVPESVFPGKKGKQPHFMLVSIQWILFWGRPDDDRKVQIVRAEWDNIAHVAIKKREYDLNMAKPIGTGDNSEAGQPHWHIDPVLELGDVDAYLEFSGTDLQELSHSSYTGQFLKLQRVHLAMAGWKNGATVARAGNTAAPNHAARWQIGYTEAPPELIEWSLSTLRYIKGQVPYISAY